MRGKAAPPTMGVEVSKATCHVAWRARACNAAGTRTSSSELFQSLVEQAAVKTRTPSTDSRQQLDT